MSPERTHYRVLGVERTATAVELRAAYLDLARRLHPDRHRSASAPEQRLAERRIREVNEAWAVLSNQQRRREYDLSLGVQQPHQRTQSPESAETAETAETAASETAASESAGQRTRSTTSSGRARQQHEWERFDADPFDRPDSTDLIDDGVEVPAALAWILRYGPAILLIIGALGLLIVTAYAR